MTPQNQHTTTGEALFDPLAEAYERYAAITDGIIRPWLQTTIPDLGGYPNSRAVDLGCGSGRFTGLLADRYQHVLGVDVSGRELSLARARRYRDNISYQQRSILDLVPTRDGLFHLVLSVNALFHAGDPEHVLPHVRSLVAPGGLAVLIDVVDDAKPRTRSWVRRTARRDAAKTLRRRRPLADVWFVWRLWHHPTWQNHITTNIPLTRDQFHHHYTTTFPGAEIGDDLDSTLCAAIWWAPRSSGRLPRRAC